MKNYADDENDNLDGDLDDEMTSVEILSWLVDFCPIDNCSENYIEDFGENYIEDLAGE